MFLKRQENEKSRMEDRKDVVSQNDRKEVVSQNDSTGMGQVGG